ncbi:ABC transporter substrate-binding protein [Auraticoccus sp. F435]|uniref:ABC transporter substrate-binding protein n=1 Tax=Auraticoccus cholistanensis TaxID=2656650 RepID=A0A6A9UQ96_9ACTN|nr:ABC transporter substrate-binding protein [Auraticoccus cholistanensis]MVA74903.1 ABC transporter substrate-binding protein [Auraticoccus cholistanensis]
MTPTQPPRPHDPSTGRRRTRRAVRGLLTLLTAPLLLLSGCTSPGPTAAEPGPPRPGGSATLAVDSPFLGFDPNTTAAAQDARAMRQMFDSLVTLDEDRQPQPWLATSWEISEDDTVYSFTVRDDVTFHDGTPFDAEAVCYNLDRIVDPDSASIYAIGLVGPYESCSASGDVARVVLSAPYAPFLTNLSSPFLGMVSPTAAGAVTPQEFTVAPVGSGPFRFVSYVPADRIVMERNPDYDWAPPGAQHQGPAYLEQLTFQIIPDATVRVGSLRNGDVQMIGAVPPTQTQVLSRDESVTYTETQQSGAPYQLLANTESGPLAEEAVRRAVFKAVDVPSIVKALYFGAYQHATSPLAPTTAGSDPTAADTLAYDPVEAARLLDAAGWTPGEDGVRRRDGQPLTIRYIEGSPNRENRQDIAEFVRAGLREVGVEVDIRLEQTAGLQAAQQQQAYDIAGLSLVSADPNVMYSIYHSSFLPAEGRSGYNMARVTDLDDELLAAQQELDTDTRMRLYSELQHTVMERAYSLPIYVPTYLSAASGLAGVRFDGEGYPIFYDSYLTR